MKGFVQAARRDVSGRNNIRPKNNGASQRKALRRKMQATLQAQFAVMHPRFPGMAAAVGAAC